MSMCCNARSGMQNVFVLYLAFFVIVAENDDIIPSFRANDNDDCSKSIGIEAT